MNSRAQRVTLPLMNSLLLAGGRVFGALKRGLGASEWVRRTLGVAVLVAVAAIALGLDSSVLNRL